MISKLGVLSIVASLGWLLIALLWIWLISAMRNGPADETQAYYESPHEKATGPDIFDDLRQRYARGEVSPEEYTEELVRVPGATGLYNPFKGKYGNKGADRRA